ncbi:MAG: cytochrome c peroxidase [Candidatus Latescibacterota bacterium]|jgi:cytochrome c peroxidase
MIKKSITAAAILLLAASFAASAQDFSLTPLEQLGRNIYFDKISEPGSMACATCHGPSVGFTGPIGGINAHGAVYRGAVPQRFGNRKPPTASYATLSPILSYDDGEGLFIGGNFWDGRATGERLGNPAADQALGPFLNPVEQNNPSKQVVLEKIAASKYAWLWEAVWGEPISWETPNEIELNYDRVGLSVAAFEDSREVNQFSSKFDVFWANTVLAGVDVRDINMNNWMTYAGMGLDDDEVEGLALFNDESKGKCSLCHVLDPYEGPGGVEFPPVLTDFTFDNLGVPKNPENPFYRMDEVYLDDGTPINPLGADWIDTGLGGFLETRPEWQAMAAENYGKQKVPTLRNVDKRPGDYPGDIYDKWKDMTLSAPEGLPKAYMHNGAFKSLKEVVHFYNTRDVADWPPPEVAENVNTDELGNLGLTDAEEDLIVLFMTTLSDGYAAPWMPAAPVAGASELKFAGANPFNPTTRLQYTIETAGNVRLDVYNVAGARVKTLVDDWQTSGDHLVEFNANELPSGIYFLRLTSGSTHLTAKAVLLK